MKYNESSVNLRGTKERLFEINPNYFLEKEIENPKELRNLSYDKKRLSALIINACSFLFILEFSFSFCFTKKECCSDEGICLNGCCISCDDCCNCNCDCFTSLTSSSSDDGLGACCGVVIVGFFVGFFYAVKMCGKTLARLINIIILFLMNVAIVVLSLCSGFDKFCI